MFEQQRIVQLHQQGYCTAAISVRLQVSTETVRAVVAKAAARQALDDLRPDNVRRAQLAKVETKRAEALQLLAEADADLRAGS